MSKHCQTKWRRYLHKKQGAPGRHHQLLLAIGGAGRSIVRPLQRTGAARILYIDTDHSESLYETMHIGAITCKGMSARTPERGLRAAIESLSEIEVRLNGVDSLILVAGLGAGTGTGTGTGTGVLPVVADLARYMDINVDIAVTLPFDFETNRRQIARSTLNYIQNEFESLFITDLNELEFGNEVTPTLLDAFSQSHEKIIPHIKGWIVAN